MVYGLQAALKVVLAWFWGTLLRIACNMLVFLIELLMFSRRRIKGTNMVHTRFLV